MSAKMSRRRPSPWARKGERVGPYRLEERLGRGAMGEVFRAYDERLDRWVALKQIHGVSREAGQGRRRFLHEARAAARLNHPAIVQVHDILQLESGDYIVMELAEGRSLGELLSGGPLPATLALAYAADIAAGLAVAHSEGIVHRDLKKENIVVTSNGRPKILDFGLAKNLQPDEESALSRDGQLIGTPRAMSPEQARGRPIDARADLFALGSLLYEMLTGVAPFDGASAIEALERVCRHHPPPPSTYGQVPASIDPLLARLLEKSPAARPPSAGWVQAEIRKLLVALTGDDDISSLAGLPYDLMEGDLDSTGRRFTLIAALFLVALALCFAWWQPWKEEPKVVAVARFETLGSSERGFFAESLPDSIVARLGRLEGLDAKVVENPTREKLEALGATYLIQGSVQWAFNERVKVRPEITRVADGTVLWSDGFYRPLEDISELQDAVAEALVEKVSERLGASPRGEEESASRGTGPAERFRLNARIAAGGHSAADFERAIVLLEHACEMEPLGAIYWADLAGVLAEARRRGFARSPSRLRQADAAAARALELAPESPLSRLAVGSVLAAKGELGAALEAYLLAGEGASRVLDGELSRQIAWVLRRQGQVVGARSRLLRALESPPSPNTSIALALVEAQLGQLDSAHRRVVEALEFAPSHPALVETMAKVALLRSRSPGQALEEFSATSKLENVTGGAGGLAEGLGERAASFAAFLALAADRPALALELLDGAQTLAYDEDVVISRELMRGMALESLGRPSRSAFESARRSLEAEVSLTADPRAMAALALTYAELGEDREARRLIERALRAASIEKDAVMGPGVAVHALQVFTLIGAESRVEQIGQRLKKSPPPGRSALMSYPPWVEADEERSP